jgi:hypothetical protein
MAIRPRCFGCERKARKDSLFCTDRCATSYAENIAGTVDVVYCPDADDWVATDIDGSCSMCGLESHRTAFTQAFGEES